MKRIANLTILIWIFSLINLNAQEESETFREKIWKSEPFKEVVIPDKYAKASCVIINRSFEFQIKLRFSYVDVTTIYHKRIKLQDNAGVIQHSSFSFTGDMDMDYYKRRNSDDQVYAGFKIIKSDGREIEIDIKELLVYDEAKKGKQKAVLNKISIPNLEIGDILDYYLVNKSKYPNGNIYSAYDPYELFLEDVYPIVEQTISIQAGPSCYLNCRSINGAPKMEVLFDESGKRPVYRIIDKNRDAIKMEKWVNYTMESPYIKFQAFYASGKIIAKSYSFFLNKPGIIKDEIAQNELLSFAKFIGGMEYFGKKEITKQIKSRRPKTKEEKIFRAFDEGKRFHLRLFTKSSFLLGEESYLQDNEQVIGNLSYFLRKYKIPHSILFTTDKSKIRLNDLFMRDDIIAVLRVDGENPLYISDVMPFSVLTDVDARFAGNQAYEYQMYPKLKKAGLKICTIPENDYKANNSNTNLEVTMSFDSLKTILEIDQSVKKVMRPSMQYPLINKVDFFEEYARKFGKEFKINKLASTIKKENIKVAHFCK